MAISFSGIVSGIDTDNIVSGLLDIQQQQLDRMSLRKVQVQQKQTAFRTLESKLIDPHCGVRSASGFADAGSS